MIFQRITHSIACLKTYVWWKNILDRIFALMLLIVLSPLLVFIAIIIRIDTPGNPIFRQLRIGKDGRLFTCYKFRTMYQKHDDTKYQAYWKKYIQENSTDIFDENGRDKYELIHDPRITRIGSLLRRSNLDEFPQLINILKGDMSFIGPRPDIAFAMEYYEDRHMKRLQAKPGMTGLWQICEDRRRLSFEDVVQLDMEYISEQSPLLDAKIVLLTFRELLTFGRRQYKLDKFDMVNEIKA